MMSIICEFDDGRYAMPVRFDYVAPTKHGKVALKKGDVAIYDWSAGTCRIETFTITEFNNKFGRQP